MGSLANHELRTLQRTAHYYFDPLYKTGRMSREEFYRWLADKICVPMKEAHIGHLGEYYCKLVIQDNRNFWSPATRDPGMARERGGYHETDERTAGKGGAESGAGV